MGARASDENPARRQELEGTEIDFFVATGGAIHGRARFSERGRIENNRLETATGDAMGGKQVEYVGLLETDVFHVVSQAVPLRGGEGVGAGIDRFD